MLILIFMPFQLLLLVHSIFSLTLTIDSSSDKRAPFSRDGREQNGGGYRVACLFRVVFVNTNCNMVTAIW